MARYRFIGASRGSAARRTLPLASAGTRESPFSLDQTACFGHKSGETAPPNARAVSRLYRRSRPLRGVDRAGREERRRAPKHVDAQRQIFAKTGRSEKR
jgi:hypothetical protein